MGILDNLTAALNPQIPGQPQNPQGTVAGPAGAIVAQVISMIESRPGGLGGLLQSFQSNGLGRLFESWVSTGQNLPVSPAQIQSTLGTEATAKIAQVTGIPQADVESHLAALLPQMINHMTPNGQLPSQGDLQNTLASVAQRFLHG